MLERPNTILGGLPTDLLYPIGLQLQPRDWTRLRLVSSNTRSAVDSTSFPFADDPDSGRFMRSPSRSRLLDLGNRFHRLELGASIRHGTHGELIEALIEATQWRHLRLNFKSFKQARQDTFLGMIQKLMERLKDKPAGWSCHLEMDLDYLRGSNEKFFSTLATCPRIASFSIRCATEDDSLFFIENASRFERLHVELSMEEDLFRLQQALANSKAGISHLVLDGVPRASDLSGLVASLAGKGLQSITLPQWDKAESADQMGYRQAPRGFQFSAWQALDLQSLSLSACASDQDGTQLRRLLSSSKSLQTLQLSGLNYACLSADLRAALAGDCTLKHVHLRFPVEQFPAGLVCDMLAAPNLQKACFDGEHLALPNRRHAVWAGMKTESRAVDPYRVHMERAHGRPFIWDIALPAPSLKQIAPALAGVSGIARMKITQCDAGNLATLPAFSQAQCLTLAGPGDFSFSSFALDFSKPLALHLQFSVLNLSGLGRAIAGSSHLQELHLQGRLNADSARELLQGLRGNASLRSLTAGLRLADLKDDVLAVELIEAILQHPGLAGAAILLDELSLLERCRSFKKQGAKLESSMDHGASYSQGKNKALSEAATAKLDALALKLSTSS